MIAARLRPTQFTAWLTLLGLAMLAGLIAGLVVFARGLVVTNLSDLVPWGLWITIDLSAIAISAGAFALCAAVYLLGLRQYQPVARTATFIGLTGYSMAVLCLLLDIGRPDRFWHALVYWNTHSVLWEVTMCVALYFNVLLLEVAPMVGEASWFRARWPGLAATLARLHRFAPVLAILGLGFSLLHQSSLGATYGVLKARPIWFRPDLSVLFILSAVCAGLAMTVLVSMLAARLTRRANVDDRYLESIAVFIGWALLAYGYFRFWDALSMTYTYLPGRTEGLNELLAGEFSFNFWVGEIAVGLVFPAIVLLWPRLRRIGWLRLAALAAVVGGVVAYRWDVNLVGQQVLLTYLPNQIVTRYTSYVPSLIEFVAGFGIVAFGLLSLTLGVKYLGIVDHRAHAHHG